MSQTLRNLLLPLVLFALAPTPIALAEALVTIDSGQLRGTAQAGVDSFKGIPFAAPPVGNLRWQAPASVTSWEGIRDASEYGPACPQTPYEPFSPYYQFLPAMSEDCLTLNVWSANFNSAAPVPVMVWIHGGSFTRGAGSLPAYDGSVLAREGVVLVTINYRLNIFGYLAHPLLTQEQGGSSGNYGLLDQIAALQWVRDNIAAFGGDPAQVTIFGESAGSSAVSQLLVSPMAAGLFARAIGQSGAFLTPQDELEAGQAAGADVFSQVGIESLEAMRAIPADELLEMFVQAEKDGRRIRPLVDGRVIPEQALALFKRGDYNKVPALVGYNRDESTAFALYPSVPFLFKNREDFSQGLKDFVGLAAYPFLWAYPEEDGSQQPYLDFWRDLVFGWNMQAWARLNEAAQQPSWLYLFVHVPGNAAGEKLGAFHASEIPYVFGNRVPEKADDERVHTLVSNYWLNFARTGNPNGEGLPQWPRYGSDENYLRLDSKPRAEESLHRWRMRLWSLAYDR